jgi:ABC-type sugar transport system ATPase subunit
MTVEAVAPPAVPPPDVLTARGIRKSFSGVEVLHGVDFSLRLGEVHGIVGQNGAGKSTLVKILDGAYSADAGEVEVHDAPAVVGGAGGPRAAGSRWCSRSSASSTMPVGHNILLAREPRGRAA